jgi:hypothetical protein
VFTQNPRAEEAELAAIADGRIKIDVNLNTGGGSGDEEFAEDVLEDGPIELDDVNKSLSENEILDVVTLFNERRQAQADEAADKESAELPLIHEPPPREQKTTVSEGAEVSQNS